MALGLPKLKRPAKGTLPLDTQATIVSQSTPIGTSGTLNTNGWLVPEEYNPDLRGNRWIHVADRMRKSDASVSEAEMHIKAPILNAEWTVEPGGEDPEDLEAQAFVNSVLFEWLQPSWSTFLWQCLLFLDHGRSIFETVEQVVETELTYEDEDGKEVTVPKRQYVAWRSISHRLSRTIYRWNEDAFGDLESVTQIAVGSGQGVNVEIPADRLAVFVYRMEGGDWEGQAILRPAHKPWVMKEMIEKVSCVAVERHGSGVWIVYLPAGHENDAALAATFEDIVSSLNAGEENYVVSPYPKAKTSSSGAIADEGITFELISPGGTIPDFGGLLAYHRGEIKAAVLARFSELGHGGTGARATGDTQSKVWRDALHATSKLIEDTLNPKIAQLVAKNFQVARPPMLRCGELDARSLAEFAVAVSQVVSSGAVEADQPFREWVRTELGAPDEAEDTQQKIEDEQGAPVPDPADPTADPQLQLPIDKPVPPGPAPKTPGKTTEPAKPAGEGTR